MTTVAVDRISTRWGSTIAYGYGTDTETGDAVVFAGDQRPMTEVGEALRLGQPIEVDVESYQILERRRPQ